MAGDLMLYLLEHGMQPGALDRLVQKMEQTRGPRPLPSGKRSGFRGNVGALSTQKPKPRMYR